MNSMSDFFIPQADAWRQEIYPILEQTTNLLYLILTKYPERVMSLLPQNWSTEAHPNGYSHVILGTSVEDQKAANFRIPDLINIRANYKVISFEPLLGPIDLRPFLQEPTPTAPKRLPFDWAILGGESGYKTKQPGKKDFRYRKCELDWLISLRDQLEAAGVPVFVKQVGSHLAREYKLSAKAGQRVEEWSPRSWRFPQDYLTLTH